MKLGSRFKRFIASLVDGIILYPLGIVLPLLLKLCNLELAAQNALGLSAEIILIAIYYAAFEQSKYQATPGKLLLKLYVTDMSGERISPWRAFMRYALHYVPFVPMFILISIIFMSPNILSEANTIVNAKAAGVSNLASNDVGVWETAIELLVSSKPVITLTMCALFIVMLLAWYIPILFKSRRGMYERLSNTVVLSR